jgi:hypothetical protein
MLSMLGLPKSTEFNKRIPKQKFYNNLSVTPELKLIFVNQINLIYWRNKLATTTMNVGSGEKVAELEVFEICLNQPSLDTKVLQLIDKEIPYHILFLLEHNKKYQAWIGYKEASLAKLDTFKVNRYYHTEWMKEDELPLSLSGLSMDLIYNNFVRQIAGDRLGVVGIGGLKEAVDRDKKHQKLFKQLTALKSKVRKEKQFNRQVALNNELKKLGKELDKF